MNNNQSSPNAISHKDLNSLFKKARKELSSIDTYENNGSTETQEFSDLIKNWVETTQKILLMMNNKETLLTKNRTPKSIMAFGAMGTHINMALQALKASEFDKWKQNSNKFIT